MNDFRPLPAGRYRLTVDDYERLDDAGAFGGHRTELIDGEVIVLSAQFRPHAYTKTELYDHLRDALRNAGSMVRAVQEVSVGVDLNSMPLPDIVVTSEPRGEGAVELSSVALLVEVADTSLATDLGVKLRLYARAGVPEYWVADVNGRVVHQLWAPRGDDYAERRTVAFGDALVAATLPGVGVPTAGL